MPRTFHPRARRKRSGRLPQFCLGLLSLGILGCTDGTSLESDPVVHPVSGQAVNGPLAGATVEIWSSGGQLLGTTSTDAEGGYALDVDTPPPYRVLASGGTLNGAAYAGSLRAECPGTDNCAVTPYSTAIVTLVDDHGLSLEQAEAELQARLGIAGDPFIDDDAADSFGLVTAREALATGAGLDDWVGAVVDWALDPDSDSPPPGLLPPADPGQDEEPAEDVPAPSPDDPADTDPGSDPGDDPADAPTPEPGDDPSPEPGDDPGQDDPSPPTPDMFTVSTQVGPGGSIDPAEVEVIAGEATSFEITTESGYELLGADGCGGTLSDDVFTTAPVDADCTVTVRFEQLSYNVTAQAGSGGSIEPASQQVAHGETASLLVTPATGYAIDSVSGCGGTLEGTTYTTGPIEAACEVSASFSLQLMPPDDLSATAGDAEVTLEWSSVEDATGYNLYWGTNPDLHPHVAGSFADSAEAVTSPHRITGLDNGVEYHFVVTSTLDAAESDPSEPASATPEGEPVPRGLNDTGIDWCKDGDGDPIAADGSAQERADGCATAQEDVPGQDGMRGRDAAARQDRIDGTNALGKLGAGAAGFDYTKLDDDGQPLPADAESWSCVLDNRTGLIWEQKRSGFGARNNTSTYAWYNPDDGSNGGATGQQAGGRCQEDQCNTHAYIQDVQRSGLCGRNDWRLPSRHELMSLRQSGRTDFPIIDTDYFANTVTARYWTRTPDAADPDAAWFIHFGSTSDSSSNPYIGTTGKHNELRVRAVAGGE